MCVHRSTTQSPTRASVATGFTLPAALALLALLSIGLAARPALATNGAAPTSSGGRAAGRGGADTAVANDATAVNTNPAGLAFIDGQRFDQTFAAFAPKFTWRNPTGSYKSKTPAPIHPDAATRLARYRPSAHGERRVRSRVTGNPRVPR